MEHALQCFARLVRVLLGSDAIAETKLACGPSLSILGVDIMPSRSGYKCRPTLDKVLKWEATIVSALRDGVLYPSEASKLGGKLAWGCTHMFRKLGRAMLRPLFARQYSNQETIDPVLRRALLWWLTVLRSGIVEHRYWVAPPSKPVHVFCDARGDPAHLGAVAFVDGVCYWTHVAPCSSVTARFKPRNDQQIMGLELLSISLALCTFEAMLRGRRVIIHSDNTGSEVRGGCGFRICACVCAGRQVFAAAARANLIMLS